MGSGKAEKPSKNPKKKRKPLAPNRAETKPKSKSKREKNRADLIESKSDNVKSQEVQAAPAAEQQFSFFVHQFQSANKVQLSSLELDSMKDTCIVELSQDIGQDVESLGNHMKAAFGPSWKESLCEKQLLEGKVDPGSPALLIISSSALRSIQLLKGFRSLTRDCRAVKLFSKHMKVEEQIGKGTSDAEIIHLHDLYWSLGNDAKIRKRVTEALALLNIILHVSMLKNRVNIASGTPSRIKKLIDIEALGLSRLAVILLDIHPDVKGYSLLTLPQIRDEFWDLYKNYFHQRLLQADMRLCLYGPLPSGTEFSGRKRKRGATED